MRSPIYLLVGFLTAAMLPGVARSTVIELTVNRDADDGGTNELLPCRVLVRGSDGNCYVPENDATVTLAIGRDRWFMSMGESTVEVPDGIGIVELRVERGHEFRRHRESIEVGDKNVSKAVTLKRWINMESRGYRCGENHLHVDSKRVGAMAIAEGLDYGTSLTWWNGPDAKRLIPQGNGRQRRLDFGGHSIVASVHDAELEHGWGAAYIQNLPEPFPFPSDRFRPNLEFLEHAVDAGALVHYQGGWSREVGLDALLGLVHTVNICNNNFHLHKFQPRSRYSNLLKIDGFPVYPDTEQGMLEMNTQTYYRLLNWGQRLAAGAGSATGAKQTPVGYNRAYVRVDPDASLDAFNQAWKAGRNFVTNGPMLFLSTTEGHRPGDTVAVSEPGDVRVMVEAVSDVPLQSVEIVVNGKVIQSLRGNDAKSLQMQVSIPITSGVWIAARCVGRDTLLSDDELAFYRRDANLSEQPSRIRFAHTSPIYIEFRGRGTLVKDSLLEGAKMVDALKRFAVTNCAPSYRQKFDGALERGHEILKSRLAEAAMRKHPLAASGLTSLTNQDDKFESPGSFARIARNSVKAVIVDNSAVMNEPELPDHRAQYNGLAFLSHQNLGADRNLFVPFYAGLNFEHIHDGTTAGLIEKFEPRKFPMELRVRGNTVEVYQPPTGNWKLESCGRYTMLEDGTIEYAFECIPHAIDYENDYIGLFWASYIHQPESASIFFKGIPRAELGNDTAEPRWIEGITPAHGVESTHGPASAPNLPSIDKDLPITLVNHPSNHVYTDPWYYGLSNGTAFMQMFRQRDGIWFAQSPTGGGEGNPAWDFQWFIRNPKVGEAYGFVMRASVLPFTDRDEIERATRIHRDALNSD